MMLPRPGTLLKRRAPRSRLALLFLLPIIGWLVFNLFDWPLEAAAKATLEATPEVVPDRENLFLAMVALPIAGDEPAHERGAAALAAYQKALANPGPRPRLFSEALARPTAVFDADGAALCSPGNRDGAYQCLQRSREQAAKFRALFARYWPLLNRYRDLEDYARFSNPLPSLPEYPPPDPTTFNIALLRLSMIALAVAEGSPGTAIESLAHSATIWRRVLGATEASLVDKMMASRALAAHTLLASELIRTQRPDVTQLAAIEAVIRPLSEDERSLAGALTKEFRAQSEVLKRLMDPYGTSVKIDFPEAPAWWMRALSKANESINLSYDDLEQTLAVERSGCVQVKARLDEAATRPPPTAADLPWHAYLYNPVGRILHMTAAGTDIHLEYLGRQCNLLALQRMVSLQLELARSQIPPEGMAGAVASSQFTDPGSGHPFAFDPLAHTLGFEPMGRSPESLSPLPLATR